MFDLTVFIVLVLLLLKKVLVATTITIDSVIVCYINYIWGLLSGQSNKIQEDYYNMTIETF